MAQYLKNDIQERIAAAALEVFAARGYLAAGMAQIAERAGVSIGNLYRYYENKQVLFEALITRRLAHDFSALLRRRVRSLDGVEDIRRLTPDAPYRLVSEDLLRFCVDHRLQVVVLLGRAHGTRHQAFRERVVRDLLELAAQYAAGLGRPVSTEPAARFVLRRIYRNLVEAMVDLLARFQTETSIRRAVDDYSKYHLAGLKDLLA